MELEQQNTIKACVVPGKYLESMRSDSWNKENILFKRITFHKIVKLTSSFFDNRAAQASFHATRLTPRDTFHLPPAIGTM